MYTHGAVSVISGASSVKNWLHQEQTGRKGVRGGEEEVWSGGIESLVVKEFTTSLDWAAGYYPHARTRAKTICCLH
jgi:hypothetical protein